MPKEIKKVLMIAPTPFFADRGCHVHIAEQALSLQRQGLEVLIVTYALGRDLPNLKTIRTTHFPWYKKLAVGPSWHKFYVDIFLIFTALKAAKKFRPDIIHGHLHEGCAIGWIVSRLFGTPLVFDCQGSLTGELLAHDFPLVRGRTIRNMWYRFEKWLDHRPSIILVQSDSMLKELTDKFCVSRQSIRMTYDGVNANVFTPGKKDSSLLHELKIPKDSQVIVFLGVLTPYQGVDDLLFAFPAIKRRLPRTILLVMGYPNITKYKRIAEELGIANSVRFPGRVPYEHAARYLALGDIAVSPKRSQTEANGKIYNYMACGLPTVAFDTVVNRNILGDLGVYVGNVGDSQQLADAIVKLLKNEQELNSLGISLRNRAVSKYSWDDVAGRILKAYRQANIIRHSG